MAGDDLEAVIRRADPDRWLSTRFIGEPELRSDVVAIYAYDQELSRAGRLTSNALMAEIRLTWWREALDEIYGGGAVRFHPVAGALTESIRHHDLPRAPLEAMIDGRIRALDAPTLTVNEAVRWSVDVAGSASMTAGLILDSGVSVSTTAAAGALWGLFALARAGLVERLAATDYIAARMPAVSRAAARLSAKAFPAVAHATFARDLRRAKPLGPTAARGRMILAVITGRL